MYTVEEKDKTELAVTIPQLQSDARQKSAKSRVQ